MKEVHVVPHSHWDREWYFTIEDSNALLIEHLDFLVNYLEENKDYPYFVFDGQVSVVEEYLRYKPEMEKRLTNLISSGRIAIGPWYTQCDSLNPKIESVIRNLQYGIHLSKKYGKTMKVGYLPDAFGQNAYLPSIFKNCNLDYSILQRGVETVDAKNGLSFEWIAPNGDSINSNYIYFGYGPGKFLDTDQNYLAEKLMPMLDELSVMSNDDAILLPSGGDQALIRTQFKTTVDELNELQSKYKFKLSNYEQFMDTQSFKNTISGELYTPQKARIHRTIHSQRMDFKILNNQVEKILIEQLEPLIVIAEKVGIDYNQTLLDEMWKSMFDVHAHDSIGGCNSDDTNRRIVARLQAVKAKAEGQINILSKKIAKATLNQENGLVVFNFSNLEQKIFNATIFSKTKSFKLFDSEEQVNVSYLSQEYIDGGTKVEVTAEGERQVAVPGYYQTNIEFQLTDLLFGYKVLKIAECDEELKIFQMQTSQNVVKTKYYTLSLEDELVISTEQKKVLFGLKVETDLGDSYDFAFDANSMPIVISKIENPIVIEGENTFMITFESNMQVPSEQSLKVETTVIVSKTTDYIKFTHKFTNTAIDYRMRAVFNTAIGKTTHIADSGLGAVERDNTDKYLKDWQQQGFAEMPLSVYPFERYVSVDNLSIINSNVKEYEITDSGLELTMIRCVGLLGKDNLSTRPGRASGINNVVVHTPDAQMLGSDFTINYNLSLIETDCYAYYNRVTDNYVCYQNQGLNLFENRLDRFELPVSLKLGSQFNLQLPKSLVLSSARVSLDNEIIYTMLNSGEEVDVSGLDCINFIGNKIEKATVSKNDYIIFRETSEK